MVAAMALAQQKQFDEEEKLATEAVGIAKGMRPPQDDAFAGQLEQIRQMRTAAANGDNPWFRRSKP